MAVRAGILIGLLACLTVRQQFVWIDDVALWRQAVTVAPTSARAAFNLSLAYRKAVETALAVAWLIRADANLPGEARSAEYRRLIATQVTGMELFGIPVCDSALLWRYC